MRDDYKIIGPLAKVEVEVEKAIVDALLEMEKHSQLTKSEIANTALKRFIAHHKDFLPPNYEAKKKS